jgi:hypothetical protein
VYWITELIDKVDQQFQQIERAKQLGTYEKDDRSKQYPLDDSRAVTKAVNECWTKVHILEAANRKKDKTISDMETDRKITRLWLKILTGAVAILVPTVGWLATNLLDCLEKGRLAATLLK